MQAQIILYSLIILIYFIFKVRKGYNKRSIVNRLGLSLPYYKYYLYALLLAIISIVITWVLFWIFPVNFSILKQTTYSNYTFEKISLQVIIFIFFRELVFITFGEELFFRGLIGRFFFNKFNFIKANLLQTIFFLIPHFLLLTISLKLFPILITISISAWFLGWLTYKSNSIYPAVLTHTLVNTFSIIYFLSQT